MREQDFVIRFGRLLHDYSFDIRNQRHLGPFKHLLTKGKATVTCRIKGDQLIFAPVEVMHPDEKVVAKLKEHSETAPAKEAEPEKASSLIDAQLATKAKAKPKAKK